MANGLRPVAKILEDVWKELKELNDKTEVNFPIIILGQKEKTIEIDS